MPFIWRTQALVEIQMRTSLHACDAAHFFVDNEKYTPSEAHLGKTTYYKELRHDNTWINGTFKWRIPYVHKPTLFVTLPSKFQQKTQPLGDILSKLAQN